METLKEKNFEVYSFLDNVKGNDVGKIIDKCVEEMPEIKSKGYGGYKTKNDLTKTLDIFLLDKNRNNNLFELSEVYKEIFKIIKETMELLKQYQKRKKYIFVFPCFDNFTVEKMNGVGGFCPKKDVVFLFLNLNGKGWKNALKGSLIHEFAHAVSEYYLGGENFNLGEGMVFDGLSESFRKINFGGRDILINAVSEKDCITYFEELKEKLDSKDFDFYMKVFYGTGKYPQWLGYSLGYYLVKNYLENLDDLDWNKLLRINPKEILSKFNTKDKIQRKILTFVVCNGKILALYSEPHPEHGEGGWFTVTGGVEGNENREEVVVREIKEETGLDVEEIFPLNWGSVYNWKDYICEEHNFVSFVKPGKITLNEEHSEYKWLGIEGFVKRIKWDDNKEVLKKVLEKALKKEKHFERIEIKDYR